MSVFMLQDDFVAIGLGAGLREVAVQDAWLQFATYDGTARDFFKERKGDKPHWFNNFAPAADNVEHAAFFSLAAQGAHVKDFGEAATRELLATEGLKLGQIKAPAANSEIAENTNPFSDKFSGTPAQKEMRIASLINTNGGKFAAELARAAGKTISGTPLQAVGAARMNNR